MKTIACGLCVLIAGLVAFQSAGSEPRSGKAAAEGVWHDGAAAVDGALDDDAPADSSQEGDMQKLAMLTGRWVRTQGDDWLEETWSAPRGDCMVGMFRWLKGGKVWMTELMTITMEDGVPVFHIRHFDRRMNAKEEKDAPLRYPLKSISDIEAVFEDPEREFPRRFTFWRPDENRYIVRFEGLKNGRKTGSQFDFTAAGDDASPPARSEAKPDRRGKRRGP